MSFDDRLRRHLHETGDRLDIGPGAVSGVRARAQRRLRRQQAVVGAVGASAVVVVVSLSVVLLRSGQGTDVDFAAVGEEELVTTIDGGAVSQADRVEPEPAEATTEAASSDDADNELVEPADQSPSGDDDPATDRSELGVAAATSTTAIASEEPVDAWTQLAAPVDAVFVDYEFVSDAVIARTTNEWYVDLGDGWQPLPPLPVEMVSIAAAFDHDRRLMVVGNFDDGPCARQHLLARHDGTSWSSHVVYTSVPGTRATLLGAEVRATATHVAISGTHEVRLDPACLLSDAGIEGAEPEVVEDGIRYVAADGTESLLTFEALELGPELAALTDGQARRTFFLNADAADPAEWGGWWSPPSEAGTVGPPHLGVVGEDIVSASPDGAAVSSLLGTLPTEVVGAEGSQFFVHDGAVVAATPTGTWLVWDGSSLAKVDAPEHHLAGARLLDVVATESGFVSVDHDGVTTMLHSPSGSLELAALSGKESLSARLGAVAGDIRLVTDSPVGPTVFGYRAE